MGSALFKGKTSKGGILYSILRFFEGKLSVEENDPCWLSFFFGTMLLPETVH